MRLLLGPALLLLGASAVAHADPSADASAHFQEGRSLFRAGRYADARAAFQAAYDLVPNPRALGNVAACLARENRGREAVREYRRFLAEADAQVPPAALREARREVARLLGTLGDLALSVEPAGAEIRIDGERLGTAPLPAPVALDPGRHRVEVEAAGRSQYAREVELVAAQRLDMRIVLDASEAAAPRPATVGGAAELQSAEPPPRETFVEPHAPPRQETPLGRGPLFWTGAGVAGALLVAGAIIGTLALSQQAEYEERGTTIARRQDLYDSMNTLATVTDVLLDAGLVLGVATTLLFVLGGPNEAGSDDVARSPWVGALQF